MCKICMKEYRENYYIENYDLEKNYQLKNRYKINIRRNEFFRNRRESDNYFRLIINTRC